MPLPSFLREAWCEETPYLSPKCAGLRLRAAGVVGSSPDACRSPSVLPAALGLSAGARGGPQDTRPSGKLSSPALEPVPQPRNELAGRNEAGRRWCRLVGQALTGCVP